MTTPRATQLAPIVVARVARRVSAQYRRVGWVMKICACFGAVFVVAAIGSLNAAMTAVGALMFLGPPLYMNSRMRISWKAADRIADAATTRSDLDWTHYVGQIRGHDRTGQRPMLELEASPQQRDIDDALPVARIVTGSLSEPVRRPPTDGSR